MKLNFKNHEDNFKKQSNCAEYYDIQSICVNSFKKLSVLISTLSIISLFFLTNNISFDKQLEFVQQPEFNISILAFYSLYLTVIIIMSTLSSAQIDKKFNSIWFPIKMALLTSFFIPIQIDNSSIFSQTCIEVIKILDKFF